MKNIFLMAGIFLSIHAFTQQTYFRLCYSNNSCAPEHFNLEFIDSTSNGIPTFSNLPVFPESNSGCYYNYGLFWQNHPVNVSIHWDLPGDITYADVQRLTRHLTGEEPFTEPYQWIAADIDKNNVVDSTDREELISYIIGTYTEFPKSEFWLFYPDTFVFANPAAPLSQPIPTVFTLPFPADSVMLSVKAVQIGDVDMSGCTISGTNTPESPASVQVYPNPAKEVLHINADPGQNDLRISLYDQLGRCVYSGFSSTASTDVSVGNYLPGLYFLQVSNREQLIYYQTIILKTKS